MQRINWKQEYLDGLLIRASGQREELSIKCNTHSNASRLRYALINRLRRSNSETVDWKNVPFSIACSGKMVTISLALQAEDVVVSVTTIRDADETASRGDQNAKDGRGTSATDS